MNGITQLKNKLKAYIFQNVFKDFPIDVHLSDDKLTMFVSFNLEKIVVKTNNIPIYVIDSALIKSNDHIVFDGKSFWMNPRLEEMTKEVIDAKWENKQQESLKSFEQLHQRLHVSIREKLKKMKRERNARGR